MEFLFEFILELVFEGSLELVQSNRVPKIIRWLLVIILILFFGGIIFGMMYLGILIMKKSFFASLFVLFVSGFMLVGCVLKGIEIYKRIHSNNWVKVLVVRGLRCIYCFCVLFIRWFKCSMI